MILKVLQPDTGKWFYYDKIHLFKSKYEKRGPETPIIDDEVILMLYQWDSGNSAEIRVAVCDLNFENGRCITVVFSEEGYLLNDEGRTIEKII